MPTNIHSPEVLSVKLFKTAFKIAQYNPGVSMVTSLLKVGILADYFDVVGQLKGSVTQHLVYRPLTELQLTSLNSEVVLSIAEMISA